MTLENYYNLLAVVFGTLLALFIGFLMGTIIWLILKGKINLTYLLSDGTEKASMARFQVLIFTVVIALSLFMITLHNNKFPDIPVEILGLLGISGLSFLISKAIDNNRDPEQLQTEANIRGKAEIREFDKRKGYNNFKVQSKTDDTQVSGTKRGNRKTIIGSRINKDN